ncbi:MAG TPA: S-methyl-5'-thioinosine phosphorylase [Rhodocyclaceae bacterium]
MLAIIGGSGLTRLSSLDVSHREIARTPYGEASCPLVIGSLEGYPAVFLARHGFGHTIPPHEVNYRANLWALRDRGAKAVVSIASVGGIREDLRPGDLLIPDQIIDYTWGRKSTFHEGDGCTVHHVDFTLPYDSALRDRLIRVASGAGIGFAAGGVYAATQGPRLETAAEINRLARDGADVVGMTGMPEAALAREIGLPYAAINVVANYAAGRGDSSQAIRLDAIQPILDESMGRVRQLLQVFARDLASDLKQV